MNDNQNIKSDLLTTISANRTKHGDFVHYILNCYHEEPIHAYWSVQQTMHLYRRLVRYDETEVVTTPTKPEEVLARLPSEFTRADAVRVGGEFGVAVRTIDRYLTIWQKTSVIDTISHGLFRRITV
jgi:hypothetical protein